MAVKLRLRRMGKKRQPIYKVVAADSRSPRDGRFIEAIGLYNPKTNPATIEINEERALYWLGVGAQPSDTVKSLLSKKGIVLKFDIKRQGLDEAKAEVQLNEWQKKQEAKEAAVKQEQEAKAKAEADAKAKAEAEAAEAEKAEKEKAEAEKAEAEKAKAEAAEAEEAQETQESEQEVKDESAGESEGEKKE